MAGETLDISDQVSATSVADVIVLKFLVKQLIAEVAATDRTPQEAAEFVNKMSALTNSLIEKFDNETDVQKFLRRRMAETADAILSGITFNKAR